VIKTWNKCSFLGCILIISWTFGLCFPAFNFSISLFSQLDLQPWRFIEANHQQQTCPKNVQNEGGKFDHVQIKIFFHDHFILLTWHVWILWYFVCGCLILSTSMSHIGSLVEKHGFSSHSNWPIGPFWLVKYFFWLKVHHINGHCSYRLINLANDDPYTFYLLSYLLNYFIITILSTYINILYTI